MPAPYTWLTAEAVAVALSLDPAELPLSAQAEQARQAAGAWVERVRADLVWADEAGESVTVVDGDVLAGAALMAARLHARAGSPLGLASFAEFGASAVLRLDPDVERLLGLGRYANPAVG